jgi:hypothetical protein
MTVTSVIGSSLEDVWGTDFSNSKKKKKSKRTTTDTSSCDVYTKNPTQFDDIMDVYSYTEDEPYNKIKYSRTQRHLSDTDAEDRDADDEHIIIANPNTNPNSNNKKQKEKKELFSELHKEEIKEKQYLDLSMYIFSGVALIFILEQFISIGIVLGSK